ncbi:hypothetical protein EDD17DRAFT_33110 [Pisolithus thermaeus]|nr:hypothetical protein EDD17DRAFT_33110 [Pisolithus thermaeus]
MSLSWAERKALLGSLLRVQDDDEEGLALDRVLHGQNVVGKTFLQRLRLELILCVSVIRISLCSALWTTDNLELCDRLLCSQILWILQRSSDRRGELYFGRTCIRTQVHRKDVCSASS